VRSSWVDNIPFTAAIIERINGIAVADGVPDNPSEYKTAKTLSTSKDGMREHVLVAGRASSELLQVLG
jgi:hypothetical protein